MRVFYAYFLLVITSLQWIGGASWYRIIHTKAIVFAMDQQEKALAAAIEHETGMEVTVELLTKDQLNPRGLIYSDFFAFSQTDLEDTTYFTFRHTEVNYHSEIEHHPVSPQDSQQESVVVQGLFQQFLIPNVSNLYASREESQQTSSFYTAKQSQGHHQVPVPPPRMA